jgi:hypothetical protein
VSFGPLISIISRPMLAGILVALALAGVQTWRLQRAQLAAAELRTELQAQRRQAAEDRAQAVAASASAAAAYRSIEQAWIHKHQEIAREAQDQARALEAARAAGRMAADGLRQRAQQLATAACPAPAPAPADPAPTPSSPPTPSPAAVLADVLGRLEAAGRELAEVADARGTAGTGCQRAYEALLNGAVLPEVLPAAPATR